MARRKINHEAISKDLWDKKMFVDEILRNLTVQLGEESSKGDLFNLEIAKLEIRFKEMLLKSRELGAEIVKHGCVAYPEEILKNYIEQGKESEEHLRKELMIDEQL